MNERKARPDLLTWLATLHGGSEGGIKVMRKQVREKGEVIRAKLHVTTQNTVPSCVGKSIIGAKSEHLANLFEMRSRLHTAIFCSFSKSFPLCTRKR